MDLDADLRVMVVFGPLLIVSLFLPDMKGNRRPEKRAGLRKHWLEKHPSPSSDPKQPR